MAWHSRVAERKEKPANSCGNWKQTNEHTKTKIIFDALAVRFNITNERKKEGKH